MEALKVRIEDIIVDLTQDLAALNAEIDEANEQIRQNQKRPASRAELEAALRDQINEGAERFRERLKVQFTLPLKRSVTGGALMVAAAARTEQNQFFAVTHDSWADVRSILDGFLWLVDDSGIQDLMRLAPTEGISAEEKSENHANLTAKKRELEVKLEQACCQLEQAGFNPDRRPDLSPQVFLEFTSKDEWNRTKFEGWREGVIGRRGAVSRLSEKRNQLILDRQRLNGEISQNGEPLNSPAVVTLKEQLAAASKEEATLAERLKELNSHNTRSNKLFNACLHYLQQQGVVVDHRL